MFRIVFGLLIVVGGTAVAQQNLFNVPSSDITEKKKLFFQQQFNVESGIIQMNSTFSFGLGKEAEIGFNVLGLNLRDDNIFKLDTNGDDKNPPVFPFFTLNGQKAFTFNKLFKLAIGTQAGFSKDFHFGMYAYSNLVTALHPTHTKIITGIYQGSRSFLGPGERNEFFAKSDFGFQVGLEQEIVEGLTLIAENISGRHNLGETSLGAAYFFFDHWALSMAHQFANPHSQTAKALVIEFTYTPSAHIHKKLFKHGHHQPVRE